MKKIKYLLGLFTVLLTATLLVACGGSGKTIKIGNTASKTGAFNAIGLPFGEAIQAVVKYYNDGKFEGGKVQGL
ncbi:MAG: hypothetical protein ACOX5Y_01555 [Acholeplasmataceae bacterium]